MLKEIVNVILNSDHRLEDNTLVCDGVEINSSAVVEVVDYLKKLNSVENDLSSYKLGDTVSIELTMARLSSVSFYADFESFIIKNRYEEVNSPFFIYSELKFDYDLSGFFERYKSLISFINAITLISKHSYIEVDVKKAIILSEQKSIVLEIGYSYNEINELNIDTINALTSVLISNDDYKKKLLFINELIEFLHPFPEEDRFNKLLFEVAKLIEKCNNAYQFYLSDFSSHKLKLELDSKALEFSQKIQSVINDSQTKLIAIPTAFILVFSVFDFNNLFIIKNIAAIISVFIFSMLLQIFLNNQKSALKFIQSNVGYYKSLFAGQEVHTVSEKFVVVESELKTQKRRLYLTEVILWSIPVSILCLWLFLIQFQILGGVILGVLIIISILIFFLSYMK